MVQVSAGWADLVREVGRVCENVLSVSQTSQFVSHHTSSSVAKQASETEAK